MAALVEIDGLPRDVTRHELDWLSGRRCMGLDPLVDSSKGRKKCTCRFASQRDALALINSKNFAYLRHELISYRLVKSSPLPSISVANVQCTAEFQREMFQLASAFGNVVDCRFSAASSHGTVTAHLSFLSQESVRKAITGLKQLSTETNMGWVVRKDSTRSSSDSRHKSGDKATVSIGAPTAKAQPAIASTSTSRSSSGEQTASSVTPAEGKSQSLLKIDGKESTAGNSKGRRKEKRAAASVTNAVEDGKKKEKKAKRSKTKDKLKKDKKDRKDKKKSKKPKRAASASTSNESSVHSTSPEPVVEKKPKLALALDSDDDDSPFRTETSTISIQLAPQPGRSRILLQPAPLPELSESQLSEASPAQQYSSKRVVPSNKKLSPRPASKQTSQGNVSGRPTTVSTTKSSASLSSTAAAALLSSTSTLELVRKLQVPPRASSQPAKTLAKPQRRRTQSPVDVPSKVRTGWTQTEGVASQSAECQTEVTANQATGVQTDPPDAPSRGVQTTPTVMASVDVQCELLLPHIPPTTRPASTQTFVVTQATTSSQTHVQVSTAATQVDPSAHHVAVQTVPVKPPVKPKLPSTVSEPSTPQSSTLPTTTSCQGVASDSMFVQHVVLRIKATSGQCHFCKAKKTTLQQRCSLCHVLICGECSSHLLIFQQTIASAHHLARMLQPSQLSSPITLSDDEDAPKPSAQIHAQDDPFTHQSETKPFAQHSSSSVEHDSVRNHRRSSSTAERAASASSHQDAAMTDATVKVEPETEDDEDDDDVIIVGSSTTKPRGTKQASKRSVASAVHFNAGGAIIEDLCVARLRSHMYVAAVTDGTCFVFQANTGRLLRRHRKVDGMAVTAVTESSQGVYYIAFSSGKVQSYQLKTGEQVNTYNCAKTAVSCLRATGDLVIVGTKSGCIYVFHVFHSVPIMMFQDHSLSITGLEVQTIDGLTLLVSSSLDTSVHARVLLISTEPGPKHRCLCCQQVPRDTGQEETLLSSHLCSDCNALLLKSQELGSTTSSQCKHRSNHTFDFKCRSCLLRRVTSLSNSLDRHIAHTCVLGPSTLSLACCACSHKRSLLAAFRFCLPCLRLLAPNEAKAAADCEGVCPLTKCDQCRETYVAHQLGSYNPDHAFVDSGWCVTRAVKPINALAMLGDNVVIGVANSTDNVQVHSLRYDACLLTINGAPKTAKTLVVKDSELFVGFFDGTIRVFDLDSGTCLRTIATANCDDWVYRLALASVDGETRLFRASRLGNLVSIPFKFQGTVPIQKGAPHPAQKSATVTNRRGSRACRLCSAKFPTLVDYKHHMNVEHTDAVAPKASFANQRNRNYPKANEAFKKLIDEERAAWQEIINKKAAPLPHASSIPDGYIGCDIPNCSHHFKTDEELTAHCCEYDHHHKLEQFAAMASSPLAVLRLPNKPTSQQIKKQWKKLSLRWHPDRNHNCHAKRVFQIFAAAYQAAIA
eukprot:m.173441 g.173441  ORF g.173441 m.173441 type:complete len:1449 (+) comp16736_c0_seq1:60-4406(+)